MLKAMVAVGSPNVTGRPTTAEHRKPSPWQCYFDLVGSNDER